jgi:AcrR family transcriptional regulator
MPRQRDEQQHEQTRQQILTIAREQMTLHGTAGLSLRAIARELDVTAPAIYRYFDRLDDLITALIADAFHALADALEAARDNCPSANPAERLMVVLLAYRQWALEHPIDFQLIYGNPIPGYVGPREITVPAVVRSFVVIVGLIHEVMQAQHITPPPPYHAVPDALFAHMRTLIEDQNYPVSELEVYLGIVGWTQMHGIIMLELFNHLQPTVGDVDVYYRLQIANMFQLMGIKQEVLS